jgi:hypothetical protein
MSVEESYRETGEHQLDSFVQALCERELTLLTAARVGYSDFPGTVVAEHMPVSGSRQPSA